jgi:serine/threonine-protein kinase
MSTGMKAALVGIPVLLLAAGAAVFVVKKGGSTPPPAQTQVIEVAHTETPKPPPPKPPPPEEVKPPPEPTVSPMVTVNCNSTPTGAAIFEEDAQIGTTPVALKLSRDKKHTLTFRFPGYQEKERTFDFSALAGDDLPVDVTLTAISRPSPPPKKPSKQSGGGSDISVFE